MSELWKSNGTKAGTSLVAPMRSFVGLPTLRLIFNDSFYFVDSLYGLWRTDGTTQGTQKVSTWLIYSIFEFDNSLFFTGVGPSGRGLYRFDDSPINGQIILQSDKQISAIPYDDQILLTVFDVYGAELWKSDGSPEGTMLMRAFESLGLVFPNGCAWTRIVDVRCNSHGNVLAQGHKSKRRLESLVVCRMGRHSLF
jgi:hypothetical protein